MMEKTIPKFQEVNHSRLKVDGLGLACGTGRFVDDFETPAGMLYAKILTSPHAHARIKKIDASRAEAIPGVRCVLTHKNVPRVPYTTAGQGHPEPSPYDNYMFDSKVRFVGDRVAAVAADTLEIAREALSLIQVEYEILPAIFDPEKTMQEGAPIIHDEPDSLRIADPKRNIAGKIGFEILETGKWFSEADLVLERRYVTHYAQHCPIEPHIIISYLDDNGRLVLRTSTQVPFHARRITARVIGWPVKKIRVIKPRIGGGFGAKQEVLIEDLCAMLTIRTGRAVRLEYTREEEFVSSRTRHPFVIYLKAGFKKDGLITDLDMTCICNTGAYGTHGLTVVANAGSKTLPFYNKAKNIRFDAKAVYTNLPVGGAYRGYGATQGAFAVESMLDEAAQKLGVDPILLRKKNHIQEGESSPVFKHLGEGREGVGQQIQTCALDECLDRAASVIGYYEKRKDAAWREAKDKGAPGRFHRGIGFAALMQGSAIALIDMAAAHIKMNEDGSFNVLAGATDLGTGSDTVLAQIAAEELGVPTEDIIMTSSDTDVTPFDVGAYASSTTFLSGMAVKKAAEKVKEQILKTASELLEESVESLRCEKKKVISPSGKFISYADICLHTLYFDKQYQIQASASHVSPSSPPPFAAHFAEVEVDTFTGFVKVLKYVAAVDCGVAINPLLAEGQTEGALLNGISYALTEEMIFDKEGRMRNPDFARYKLFSTQDIPEIITILVPTFEPTGPFGAKSIAEISINGPLPAIANAICDAVGVRMTSAPFTPEKVLAALKHRE